MNTRLIKYLVFLLPLMVLVAGCSVTKHYHTPEISKTEAYRGSNATDTASMATLHWTRLFSDTLLQGLIREGIANNLDLKVAYLRITQAEAYFKQSKAAFFPSLDANAGVSVAKLSEAQGFGIRTSATQYQLGLATSWEADIWGKIKSNKHASLASLLQTEAGVRLTQSNLVAGIASYYYTLMALDKQMSITQQTILNWDTTVVTMQALKEAAIVTEAAVVQSEAQRYAAEVTIPDLEQAIRETEHALSILLGRHAGAIRRNQLDQQQPAAGLATGIPAQLLANRPDVQQAEQNFRYYFEMTNVAHAYFYPTLSITGSAGLNSLSFEELFKPASIVANIAGGIVQPIFNRRSNKTRLEVARAQQEEAYYNFQNTILNAGREVSDYLFLHEAALKKMLIREKQTQALTQSVAYTQELLRYGFANYNEIITARQSLLQAELGHVNDQLQQLQAIVSLYKALGGGWR